MPAISGKVTLSANTSSGNVIINSPYEFVAVRSRVILAASADEDDVVCDFQLGGETLVQAGLIKLLPATITGRSVSPDYDEDTLVAAQGDPGERIFLNFQNNGTGSAVIRYLVGILP